MQDRKALVVGIDEYASTPLFGCGADAKAVEHDQKATFFHLGFLHFFRVSPDK